MIFSEKCPHCGEETEISEPQDTFDGRTAEQQDNCTWCEGLIVAVFRVEYTLTEVRKG